MNRHESKPDSTAPTTEPTPAIPSEEPKSQVSTAPQGKPISEQQAITAAKRMDPEGNAIWTAQYLQSHEVEPGKAKRDVWAVTAEYPAGNRMIVWLDAVIGISKQTLLEAWGEPDEIGQEHVEYLRYGPAHFYIWEGDRVGVIDVVFKGTADDVRGKLGVPAFDGASEAGVDEYMLGYETGRSYLYFKYTDKNADHGVLRFKNPHGGFCATPPRSHAKRGTQRLHPSFLADFKLVAATAGRRRTVPRFR